MIFFGSGKGTSNPLNWISLGSTSTSFTPNGITVVAVGNITAQLNNASDPVGATVTLAGTDAASFQLSNSGLYPCTLQAKSTTTTGTYNITLQINRSDVNSNTAYPVTPLALTLTGSISLPALVPAVTFGNITASAIPANTSTPFFWQFGYKTKSMPLRASANSSGATATFPFVPNWVSDASGPLFATNLTTPANIPAATQVISSTSTTITFNNTCTITSGDNICFSRFPAGYMPSATMGGTSIRIGVASHLDQADGALGWFEGLLDATGTNIAGSSNNTSLVITPTVGNISSGTYTSATGAVSLVTSAAHGLSPGSIFQVYSLAGAGSPYKLNGIFTATTGTTGTTLNYTTTIGLGTVTITGGAWDTTTRTNSDWAGLVREYDITNLAMPNGGTATDQIGSGTWKVIYDATTANGNIIETRGVASTGLMVNVLAPVINTSAISSLSISSITFTSAPSQWNGAFAGYAAVTTTSAHGIPSATFICNGSQAQVGINHVFVPNPSPSLVGQMVFCTNKMGALVPQCQITSVQTGTSGVLFLSRPSLQQIVSGDTIVVGNSVQGIISGATPNTYNGWQRGAIAIGTSTILYPMSANPGSSASSGTWQQCHRALYSQTEFWVTQKSDGTLGPIARLGPFIRNDLLYNTSPGCYTFDLAIKENGSTVRSELGVMCPAGEDAQCIRVDAEWEWTANDPCPLSSGGGIWTNELYTDARKTLKIPCWADGITATYSGFHGGQTTVSSINTTTGVFTVPFMGSFCRAFSLAYPFPCGAVDFTSTGTLPSITGGGTITAGTRYWARSTASTGTTFILYNTKLDAFNQTNPIIPSNSGSGTITIRAAAGPGTCGMYQYGNGQGDTVDFGTVHECDASGYYGNSAIYDRLSRIHAYCFPEPRLVDGWSGLSPSILPQSLTPAGMGYGKIYTGIQGQSNGATIGSLDVNAGITPTGPTTTVGGNTVAAATAGFESDIYHSRTPPFVTWLRRPSAYLRDVMIRNGHYMLQWPINNGGTAPVRNFLISGTNYYGNTAWMQSEGNIRHGANASRDVLMAYFIARTIFNDPQAAYFHNILAQWEACRTAYASYEGSNYQALGWLMQGNDFNGLDTTGDFSTPGKMQGNCNEMVDYLGFMVSNLSFVTMLLADLEPGLVDVADFNNQYLDQLYTSVNYSAYFSTAFYMLACVSDLNSNAPGTWVTASQVCPIYNQTGSWLFYYKSDGTIQWRGIQHYPGINKAPYGWAIALNDKFFPLNYDPTQLTAMCPTPAQFTDGTQYYLRAVTNNGDGISGSFKLSTITDDTGIISSVTPRGGVAIGYIDNLGNMTLLSVTDGLFTINDFLCNGNKNAGTLGVLLQGQPSGGAKITSGSGLSWVTNYQGSGYPGPKMTVATVTAINSGTQTRLTFSPNLFTPNFPTVGMTILDSTTPGNISSGTTITNRGAASDFIDTSVATTIQVGDVIQFAADIFTSCGAALSPGANSIAAAPTVAVAGVPAYMTTPTGGDAYYNEHGAAFAQAALRGKAGAVTNWNQYVTRRGTWNDTSTNHYNLQPTT